MTERAPTRSPTEKAAQTNGDAKGSPTDSRAPDSSKESKLPETKRAAGGSAGAGAEGAESSEPRTVRESPKSGVTTIVPEAATASGGGPASSRSAQPAVISDELAKLCREVLGPLVRADGGEMHLVAATGDDVHIHLSGTCAGCPGAALTRDRVLAPIILAAFPKARVVVTTGFDVPDGAMQIVPV
jgi:Fe-S cluster biogenesis protein NfuA